MNVKKTMTILSVVSLAMAAFLGVIAYRTASAQEPTPTTPSAAAPFFKGLAHGGLGKGVGGGFTNEDLANALGITVDELNTAYQTANDAALDQAVQAGLITQAQADELRARGTAFPFGGRWGGWLSQNGIDYEALLADALGVTVDELQAAYAQAYSARIDQAVADGRLTQEQADLLKGQYVLYANENFQSSMQSAFEAAVNQAVADGVITQAQADQILQNAANMRFSGFGLGRGFHGGRPGRHGGWGGAFPADPAAPESPAVMPSNGL